MFNIKTRDVSFCSFCKQNLTRTTMGPAFQLLSPGYVPDTEALSEAEHWTASLSQYR